MVLRLPTAALVWGLLVAAVLRGLPAATVLWRLRPMSVGSWGRVGRRLCWHENSLSDAVVHPNGRVVRCSFALAFFAVDVGIDRGCGKSR